MSFVLKLIPCNFISRPKVKISFRRTYIFISRYGIRSMVLKLGSHCKAFRNYEKHAAKLQAAY